MTHVTVDDTPRITGGAAPRPLPAPERLGRLGAIALVAAALGVAAGQVVVERPEPPPRTTAAPPSSPEEAVARLEQATRNDPDDARAWRDLAVAYVQAVAAGGDLAAYVDAEAALRRATALAPDDAANDVAGGYLALARHDFARAHELGSRAHAANPDDADALAILVDAEIELGRYDDAERTLAKLLDVRPGLAAYSRVSYLRELHGDTDGARQAFALAETAGAGSVYDLANVAVLRGKLAVAHGELEEAERAFARARDHVADAANADAGEARVLIARGELDAARAQLEQAMRDAPTAEVALLLGELYAYSGVTDPPVDVDTFLDANAADEQAAGADVDMERSLVLADRGEPREALRLARRAYERRPSSIFTASALAWALHLRGQDAAAAPLAEASLRLGTRDALLRYRAAAVFAGAGLRERARAELETAFSVNPTFSLRHHAAACDLGAALGVSCPVIANPR